MSRKVSFSGKISLWLLAVTYGIVIACVASIGFVVESNATQTQQKVCDTLRINIRTSVELTLYFRSITEGVPIEELRPTALGKTVANDLRREYEAVCNAPLD